MSRTLGGLLLLALLSPCALAQQRPLTPAEKLAILQAPKPRAPDDTPAAPIPKLAMFREHEAGTVGPWYMAVTESGWLHNPAPMPNSFMYEPPRGVLLVVAIEARNRGAASARPPVTTLLDERGHAYDASGLPLPNTINPYDSVNPGLTISGLVSFDVPRDRIDRHFWLMANPEIGPRFPSLRLHGEAPEPPEADPRVVFFLKPKTY